MNLREQHNIEGAAHQLGVSKQAIRRWIAERKLAHVRLGRIIRIPQTSLDEFCRRGIGRVDLDKRRRRMSAQTRT